ncbi:MAG: DNA polymerase III subunit alpha [Clostridia bacterium]|nr:DNA polymerase III subunit alpha [Clostridia bacterium]
MSGFVHLHLHTEYSLLDGATRISTIADKALSDGQSAVAITDHGVMYGAVEFYTELKKKGVKPIIGCEVYVAPRSRLMKDGRADSSGHHLVLLCKNAVGYKNLCYMVSMSFIDGFYSKPRIDMELLHKHSEGLIALSGCVGGKIPQLILAGSMPEAEEYACEMKDIFGEDFFLEVQNHGLDEERRVAFGLKLISEKQGIPLVATNDVHYLEKSDADTQAILMCVQTGNVITDGRPFGFETDEFYFKTESEMRELFAAFPGAVDNTVLIADRCNFDFEFDKLHLPDFQAEGGLDHKTELCEKTYRGFNERRAAGRFDFQKNPESVYLDRIEYELSVIDKMGFNAYFLIVSDFVRYAKSSKIPVGPGRGSGAGSLVAFCIDITDVDPLAFDLLFERFLNPERVSMPDFDIDFCYNRREEVIDYVKRKYGEDKVAQIVTFGTLAPRAAVRDVGRALGMPYGKVDTVAKLIPHMAPTIDSALSAKELRAMYLDDAEVRRLIDVSRGIEGMPRHASTHAAGVVMTEKPTYEYVPLSYSGTGIVTQFDMNTDAKLGLVKFDFLGLRYITVISDAEREVRRRFPDFDIERIPLDDAATFKLLREGRTDGIFQLESGGMKQVLMRLEPSSLEDVIACIALYRPGPMSSIDSFIERKWGREPITYRIEALREILDVTYGCIVYQEQVMQICRLLAGYTYARADIVRRAMSKKKAAEMLAERDDFISGCAERGIDKESAEDIFEKMQSFAAYAFNKSHATAYGIISYRTAYLKAHYPAEYYAALLTSVLDSPTKLKKYIADAHKLGVSVMAPDINVSDRSFTVCEDGIRFGLLAIRNVGVNFADAVVRERSRGEYKSFQDFVVRLARSDINKRTLESLIKCGVFDRLGVTRSALLASYEGLLQSEQDRHRANVSGQMDLFSLGGGGGGAASGFEYPDLPEFSLRELLLLEKESSGMYFSGHMIDNYSFEVEDLGCDVISDIIDAFDEENPTESAEYADKSEVTVAGIISAKRTKQTKNGDTMAFITLEDRTAEIVVIAFAKQYAALSSELFVDNAVSVKGRISHIEGEAPEIILSSLTPLTPNSEYKNPKREEKAEQKPLTERIYIRVPSLSDPRISSLERICAFYPGKTQIALYDMSTGKYSVKQGALVAAIPEVLARLADSFGSENVVKK